MTQRAQEQTEEQISISEEDLAILVATRSGAAYVMSLLSRTARPTRGAAPLLRALGAMAKIAVEALSIGKAHWFFGTLSVDVCASSVGSRSGLTVDVMTDHGGPREALFERFYFAIPFEEFRWMVERIPELAGPLRLRPQSSGRILTSGPRSGLPRFDSMTLYVPPQRTMQECMQDFTRADDTAKIIVSPESLFDPDSTSPVPALMAEMAHLSLRSYVDASEL